MRKSLSRYHLAFVGAASIAALGVSSCSGAFETTSGGGSGAGAASSGSGGGSASGGGGVPGCSDPVDGQPVKDGCGIFVSDHGSTDGDGSLAKPLRTLAAALAPAGPLPIYACGTFDEVLVVKKSLVIWGGFDCSGTSWIYHRDDRSKLTASAGHAPLVVEQPAASIEVHSFAIDGEAASAPGASAIAVAVDDGVDVNFSDCDLTAGDAADGADATEVTTPAHVGAGGETGTGVPSAPCALQQDASHGGSVTCGGEETRGGTGGLGGSKSDSFTPGAPGSDGSPYDGASDGKGGAGETESKLCVAGQKGLPGAAGKQGKGGKDTELGLAVVNGGAGEAGTSGGRGHGGGGGGGSAGGDDCSFGGPLPGVGGAGGGGGSGGCGGEGGASPTAGGSSIALISLGGAVTFTNVKVSVGHAGRGGAGAHGQPGGGGGSGAQPASVGGLPAHPACAGGDGGDGGRGGASGGARGGHAIGVAFAKSPSGSALDVSFTAGTAGAKGQGGGLLNAGVAGIGASCWDFATNAACPHG